jgi:hypothetical protein
MGELIRGERLQIMLTQEELTALDDWRFARRMPTRAAAIRELLKRGLAVEGLQTADGASKSKDFGVLSARIGYNSLTSARGSRFDEHFGHSFHHTCIRKLAGKLRNHRTSQRTRPRQIAQRLAFSRENYRLMCGELLKIAYLKARADSDQTALYPAAMK